MEPTPGGGSDTGKQSWEGYSFILHSGWMPQSQDAHRVGRSHSHDLGQEPGDRGLQLGSDMGSVTRDYSSRSLGLLDPGSGGQEWLKATPSSAQAAAPDLPASHAYIWLCRVTDSETPGPAGHPSLFP